MKTRPRKSQKNTLGTVRSSARSTQLGALYAARRAIFIKLMEQGLVAPKLLATVPGDGDSLSFVFRRSKDAKDADV